MPPRPSSTASVGAPDSARPHRPSSSKGLAQGRTVTAAGLDLRRHIEDETDRLGSLPWQLLGEARSEEFADRFEPPCELLLARVDVTAGPNYQPASRIRIEP